MPTFATPEPITVAVDLAGGTLTIVASDRTDTAVSVTPTDPSKPGDVRAAEEAVVAYADGTLSVRINRSWRTYSPFGSNRSADVTIDLPTGSSVQGGSLGPLFAQGRLGACTFTSRAGDVHLETTDRLDVRASAGSVVVGRVSGSAEIVVGAGSVRVRELAGDAVVKNSTGTTEIGETIGTLRVNGAHGTITIGRSQGDTTARCAHGNVRVENAVSGRVQIESSFGGIEVGVPAGTAAWLDATSEHGTVRNLLDDASGPADGDETVEVTARTGWGNVTVRRPNV